MLMLIKLSLRVNVLSGICLLESEPLLYTAGGLFSHVLFCHRLGS